VRSADYDPGPIQKVSCEPVGERWTLVLTCDIGHAVDAVWAVITEPDQLRQWAPLSTTGTWCPRWLPVGTSASTPPPRSWTGTRSGRGSVRTR
jgi:hypothetical protein